MDSYRYKNYSFKDSYSQLKVMVHQDQLKGTRKRLRSCIAGSCAQCNLGYRTKLSLQPHILGLLCVPVSNLNLSILKTLLYASCLWPQGVIWQLGCRDTMAMHPFPPFPALEYRGSSNITITVAALCHP